jgi:hypothetical protein
MTSFLIARLVQAKRFALMNKVHLAALLEHYSVLKDFGRPDDLPTRDISLVHVSAIGYGRIIYTQSLGAGYGSGASITGPTTCPREASASST